MAQPALNDYFVYDKSTGELVPYAQAAGQPGFDLKDEILFGPDGQKYVGSRLAEAIQQNASRFDPIKTATNIGIAFMVPVIGAEIGASLMASGTLTSAASASNSVLAAGGSASQAAAAAASATNTATAVGTAIASSSVQVAQGVPVEDAIKNATVTALVQTQSPDVAKSINSVVNNPAVTNLIASTGASIVQTAATGGNESDIIKSARGALVGSGVSSATDSSVAGRAAGGAVTGGVAGALVGAAGALGAEAAKPAGSSTTTPTTQTTLTPNLTDAQVSQIQNALGISVSDTTNNDVKLALGPLLAPLGAGAAIVSDSVIPLIGIFGAKAISDTIDYFKNQNDSAGFYQWVNENMQAADDRLQNRQSLNPAGAGRGFVNPPVATTITPSQAAITGSYGAGFSGAGGGAGAGVTAGEATAGEQEARDFLKAQKVTHPEIDFATLAKEPALNELPADKKIVDLIQPGAAFTAATDVPGTTPADREILNLTGITQPATAVSTATAPTTVPATTPAVIATTPPAVEPVVEPPPLPPVVEPPVTTPPVVSEPATPNVVVSTPDTEPPPTVEVKPKPPVVEDKPVVDDKVVVDEKPPADEEPPPDEEVEPEYKPELFIYGGTTPKRKTRTTTNLGTTLQAPFYPSTTLGQALTGYRGAGEIEGKKTGKPRRDVWNEESLRLKDALGL